MEFRRDLLIQDLSKVMPGISTGQITLEGADSFIFKDGYVHTYNSAISVSAKLSQPFINGNVNAVDLYNSLLKFPEDNCSLEEQTDKWIITCKRIKLTVKLLTSANIMERFVNIVPNDQNWSTIDGMEFQNALKLCYMPSNKTKFAGVIMKDGFIISTDGWQANRAVVKGNLPFCWLNNDAVKNLLTWKSFTAVQFNRTWLQFTDGNGVIFSVKTLFTDNFPLENVMGSFTKTENLPILGEGQLSDTFFAAIDRASGFLQKLEDYSTIDLVFAETGVTIKSRKASGAYEEVVEDIKCPINVETHIDPEMLLSTQGKFSKFVVRKASEVPGKGVLVRFEFKTDAFTSVLSSMS